MSSKSPPALIRLRGVRHHNLKNFDLDLPVGKLIVVTGLSGSGKSSLAFDTLFAEGQRRYIETFSPYARQFFDRMDKPQVDRIEGIPPAIAIEQRNAVKSTRSTVGTMTELTDYMKLLWPHLARLHCRQCGQLVRKETPAEVWQAVGTATANGGEALITFDLALSEKLSLEESLKLVANQGYQRLLVNGVVLRLEEVPSAIRTAPTVLTVVQDRIKLTPQHRSRFQEGCEQAFHFGKGRLTVFALGERGQPSNPRFFSNRLHCATCDLEYREPSPALFSFNHPLGACPTCRGFGRTITIDYQRALPDRSRSLAEGVVKPWQVGHGLESQKDLTRMCKARGISMKVPFAELPPEQQRVVIEGDPGYGSDEEHQWPRAWYGVKGYFRWLESKAYKMHVRVLLSRYRAYTLCPDCRGRRLQPEALLYQLDGRTLADFYQLPVRDALAMLSQLEAGRAKSSPATSSPARIQRGAAYPELTAEAAALNDALPLRAPHAPPAPAANDPLRFALREAAARLHYLNEVGLGYLTLDRPTRSLSGGETERVNLTTCLGTRLVNTLYVLDEPSVGLHPRDTERLVRILHELRDLGNTVVVVEHEPAVMRAADHLVDLGPGHGESGGELVYSGDFAGVLRHERSLTGQYLSGRRQIPARSPRPVDVRTPRLRIEQASLHNLKNLTVEIPLGRFVCLTGVSGSGKSTLARDVIHPLLAARLGAAGAAAPTEAADEADGDEQEAADPLAAQLSGGEGLGEVVLVDQSPLGRTPRSTPAVYVGAFEPMRDLFAMTEAAKQRGLNSSAFSFNSAQGQCEKCRGAGFEKIEMQFLSDIFVTCGECHGRRYREHILEVKLENGAGQALSIADLLDATIDEVVTFLGALPSSRAQRAALTGMTLLQDVGLGYLRAGQPINTLSGGESQRLKLVSHLAESATARPADGAAAKPKLFIFDEPTTGLHFDDVRVLVDVFQRLVDEGHSLLVIEHNLELLRCADWLVDLGPEAGDRGGELVAEGTPDQVALHPRSHTGAALAGLNSDDKPTSSPRRGTIKPTAPLAARKPAGRRGK